MTRYQSIGTWFRRVILRDRAAKWNHQYAIGQWEGLKAAVENPRFDACIALVRRHVPGGRLLDIGCGEALMQQRLAPNDYQRLVGVDISSVAIGRAQIYANDRVRYLVANMQDLELDETFDAVIFTESLYYVSRCHHLLRDYARFLREGGVFIISIYRNKRSARTWAQIHSVAVTIDRATTTSQDGVWDCEVLRLQCPQSAIPPGPAQT